MSIEKKQEAIIDEFTMLDDWMQKYDYLIELGKSLPLIGEQYKTSDQLIKGCQGRVWLNAALNGGKVLFTADSDAIITKGIISLLIRVLSNESPEDIVNAHLHFIDRIDLGNTCRPPGQMAYWQWQNK